MAATVIVPYHVYPALALIERAPFVGLNLWSLPRLRSLCRWLVQVPREVVFPVRRRVIKFKTDRESCLPSLALGWRETWAPDIRVQRQTLANWRGRPLVRQKLLSQSVFRFSC